MKRWLLLLLFAACAPLVRSTYPGDVAMWGDIFAHAEHFEFDAKPVAAVAPHHLIDAHELAGFWSALLAPQPSVVVLIAPDHFLKTDGLAMGEGVRFATEYGALTATSLEGLGVPARPDVFPGEHSVHVHANFIAKLAPGARFVPVLAKWGASRAELEQLAQRLHALLPLDALVVASVDFSHYQPEPWATFHDEAAFTSVSGFELDELFLREVDSPESLFVAMRFSQLRGAERATRWLHTNSQRRRTPFVRDSTSHQYFTFSAGALVGRPSINLTLTGRADVEPSVVERWTWVPGEAGPVPSPRLDALRGQEDRFFLGGDLVVFDVAPGSELRRTLHGLTVVVRGVELASMGPLPPRDADCVVLVAHRGAVEIVEAERRARGLLGAADVVLGRGFGVAREVEWDGDGLLALSLGDWSGDGQGAVAGVTCTPNGARVRTVPLVVRGGIPSLDLDALRAQLRPE